MSFKENMSKIMVVSAWCISGAGMLVLLIAAINKRNNKACTGYAITITGNNKHPFLNKKTIENIVTDGSALQPVGQPIASFDLKNTEAGLKKNVWVRDAQLFFDNNEVLQIVVSERDPVARVLTTAGSTFYIDSSGDALPVPPGLPVKLPVFTGYPDDRPKSHADSSLLVDMKNIGGYILKDSFWMAQIDQIDITSAGMFQLYPLVGNQVIEFGDGEDYPAKFGRLFVFYKDVLCKTGFNKYSRINVQNKGQIVATRKGGQMPKSDSLKFLKDIRQLIQSAQQIQGDTVLQQTIRPLESNTPSDQLDGDDESNRVGKDSTQSQKKQLNPGLKAKATKTGSQKKTS